LAKRYPQDAVFIDKLGLSLPSRTSSTKATVTSS
jgi:hypothetical protein